jgi:hypothetical protein
MAQVLVIRYGPKRRILLSAMGHGAAIGCELRAKAQNQLPKSRITQQFLNAFHILQRDSDDKKVYVYKLYL